MHEYITKEASYSHVVHTQRTHLCPPPFFWCTQPCKCFNPTMGHQLDSNPVLLELWNTAFENTKIMAAAAEQSFPSLELALLGDSITGM
jgi:hypothetical protein